MVPKQHFVDHSHSIPLLCRILWVYLCIPINLFVEAGVGHCISVYVGRTLPAERRPLPLVR